LLLITNSIYGYQHKTAKKKKSRGKQMRLKEGRKNYDDLSKPGLPDFVSGLVPHFMEYLTVLIQKG